MARERGMTLKELNALGEREAWTDNDVDMFQKKIGETEDNCIIEGRTSFLFIPHSLKIFIDVKPRVGAERVFNDLKKSDERNEDTNLTSVDSVIESHANRIASDMKRYKHYYGINVYDTSQYDFVLDTSKLNIDQSFAALEAFVSKARTKGHEGGRIGAQPL
jgi:cytidylate kinase